jgi:phage shock protein A
MLIEALKQRSEKYKTRIGQLAYEKIGLLDRMKSLETSIQQLEAAITENEQALKDANTQDAINKSNTEVK